MFAVIVLGIGFIMIASVFPVALSQSKATKEETTAAAVGQQAMEILKQLAQVPGMFPATDFGDPQNPRMVAVQYRPTGSLNLSQTYMALRGQLVNQTDPRFGIAVFYQRRSTESFARFIVLVCQSQGEGRNTFNTNILLPSGTDYDPESDIFQNDSDIFYNLRPRMLRAQIIPGDPVGKITFSRLNATQDSPWVTSTDLTNAKMLETVAPGSFVIVHSDRIDNTNPQSVQNRGRLNGRIFKVGQPAGTANQFELDAAWDFAGDPGYDEKAGDNNDINAIGIDKFNGSQVDFVNDSALVYVMGRPIVANAPDAGNPDTMLRNLDKIIEGTASFRGPAMDVAVYTTYIEVR